MCNRPEPEKRAPLVPRDRGHDLLVAALDQHVGHGLADLLALRDRKQMRLAFGQGALDQHLLIDAVGIAQHGAGDLDLVVEGELLDDVERGVIAGCHQLGELRPRRHLDLVGEPADDLAEHADLVVAVAARDQDVGRMPQRLRAALVGAARNRVVQILQKRFRPVHLDHPNSWSSFGAPSYLC
ncbi:hypothetical protein ACVWY3_000055 [Bradyrhizobium sp. USDA 4486]